LLEVRPLSNHSLPAGATAQATLAAVQEHFLAILPRIETHARVCFRGLKCPGKHADAVAETIAIAWRWFLQLDEQGKNVDEFVSALASYAARHVRCGRRLCAAAEKARDVLSAVGQHRHGFRVEPLASSTCQNHERLYGQPHGQDHVDALEEHLRDNTRSPVAEQAAFRIDYPAWLGQLGSRHRAIVGDMALAHSTGELALKHKVSPARISQMRREFHLDWQRFHGEAAPV
jgi:hypothetical protein